MLNSFNKKFLTCEKHADCSEIPDTTCCWKPGENSNKQCTKTPDRIRHLFAFTPTNVSRERMLNEMKFYNDLKRLRLDFSALVLLVGQGDCVAMYCPNGNLVMFDCGSLPHGNGNALTAEEVKEVLMDNVKKVTIFISHGDIDHYIYLPTVFDNINIIDSVIIGGNPKDYKAKMWMKDLAKENKLYAINNCKKCIRTCNNKLHIVKFQEGKWIAAEDMTTLEDMKICGNAENIAFDIIAANIGKDTNEKSIVLRVSAVESEQTRSMLLSGDIKGIAARTVANYAHYNLKSDIYQISHHGASTGANKFDWLNAIKPKQAFVSHAYNNQYGHPRCEAIRNLINIGSILTRTTFFSPGHLFTCGEKLNSKTFRYTGNICHHIFSTSPAKDIICTRPKKHFKMNKEVK